MGGGLPAWTSNQRGLDSLSPALARPGRGRAQGTLPTTTPAAAEPGTASAPDGMANPKGQCSEYGVQPCRGRQAASVPSWGGNGALWGHYGGLMTWASSSPALWQWAAPSTTTHFPQDSPSRWPSTPALSSLGFLGQFGTKPATVPPVARNRTGRVSLALRCGSAAVRRHPSQDQQESLVMIFS